MIRFGPAAAMAGAPATVQGNNWPAGTPISFSLGGVNTGAAGNYGFTVADRRGGFTATVQLDRYPDGTRLKTPTTVVLVAHTADWRLKATAPIVVASPRVVADRTAGPAGSTITLRGQGWPVGTAVRIALGDINTGAGGVYGRGVADASGRFTIRVRLAALPGGVPLKPGLVRLVVHNGDSSLTAVASFSVTPR